MPFSKRAFGVSLKHLSALCKKGANARRINLTLNLFCATIYSFSFSDERFGLFARAGCPVFERGYYPITTLLSLSLICKKSLSFTLLMCLLVVFLLLSKILTCPKSATCILPLLSMNL